jgi:basic membrane lipoprotein Med (substrate-binding protein (PBP1-ABC) superfamily)
MNKKSIMSLILLTILAIILTACGGAADPTPAPEKLKMGLVLDQGGTDDKGFNEYTLAGARRAVEAAGMETTVLVGDATDFEASIETVIAEDVDLVVTVGFLLGDATAKAARKHPDLKFVIVDNAYFPGFGCPDTVEDCYSEEGGLANVTSLMFAEDEVAYLAGVLAACVSQTGTVGTVAGMEIPPVVRFVTGFENGAKSVKSDIVALRQYIPDFNDPATGKVVAQDFINQGADVIFGAGGSTGNGGLLAAKEAGLMAIGVDVDQYFTYPEVQGALVTSAMKKVDVAAEAAVKDFVDGQLRSGIRTATIANGGIGLAPYHDWESKIPQECKDQVTAAEGDIKADPTITGAK